jgi:hypothetical protein
MNRYGASAMMHAIEFIATVKNGMIPIPKKYLAQLQTRLKVIVLQEKPKGGEGSHKQKEAFLAKVVQHRFDLPQDYHFNREDLYDRI